MPGSTTTSADLEGVASAPTPRSSIADASKAFLEGLSPEERDADFDQDDLPIVDDTKAKPTPDPASEPDDDDDEEGELEPAAAITRADGATWNVELGRWQDAAGKFVSGEAPANAPAPTTKAPAEPATDDDGEWLKVPLPALKDGEQSLEFEIDDPDIADRIHRLVSDAGRTKKLQREADSVRASAAELAEVEQQLTVDPVGFIISKLTPERRLAVARATLLEHFDELQPDIEAYLNDPSQRHAQRVELRDSMTESATKMAQARSMREHAQKCIAAVEAMIPDGADDESAQLFLSDARSDLARAASAGQDVRPETVAQLLAQRAKLYGFSANGTRTAPPVAAPPATRSASSSTAPPARPVSDRARDLAARQTSKADAVKSQDHLRRVQTQRRAATRVAPAGAGAAPVQVPVLPPEAKANVNAATKYLRQNGKISETWAPARP